MELLLLLGCTSISEAILFLTIFDRGGFCCCSTTLLSWLVEFSGLWLALLLLLLPLALAWSPLSPSKAQAAITGSSSGSSRGEDRSGCNKVVFDVMPHGRRNKRRKKRVLSREARNGAMSQTDNGVKIETAALGFLS